jgi:hypothetical protein
MEHLINQSSPINKKKMKRTKSFITNLWIAFVMVFFTAIRTEGQVIKVSILPDATNDNNVALSGTFGTGTGNLNFQFTLDGGTVTGNWNISGCGASCPVVLDNPASGAAHITIPSTPLEINFDVNVNGGTFERHVTIKFRNPIDLVLVLDKSGSMGTITTGTIRRWDALITAVDAFVDKFELYRVDGDRVSISYFHSVVENGLGTAAAPFIDIKATPAPSSRTQVDQSLAPPNGPAGATAMGLGLVDAKDKLAPSTTKTKVVLLFTDGEQNWPNNGKLVAATGDKLNDNTPINTGPGNTPGNIKIYTIGINSAGSIPAVLSAIASSNRGLSWTTQTGSEASFVSDFTNAFAQMLSVFSPQIIGSYSNTASGPSHSDTATFICNQTTDKLVFELYSPGRIQVGFEKDGKPVNPSTVRSGQGYQIFAFNFPHSDPTIKPGGKWVVKMLLPSVGVDVTAANTSKKFTYNVIAITDDHSFDYTCSQSAQKFKPGDDLTPAVKLTLQNKEVINGHVNFVLLKPDKHLGIY